MTDNKKNQMTDYLSSIIKMAKEETGCEVEVEYTVNLSVQDHHTDSAPQQYYDRLTTEDIDEAYEEFNDTLKEVKRECFERFNHEKIYGVALYANVFYVDEDGEKELYDDYSTEAYEKVDYYSEKALREEEEDDED